MRAAYVTYVYIIRMTMCYFDLIDSQVPRKQIGQARARGKHRILISRPEMDSSELPGVLATDSTRHPGIADSATPQFSF